MKKTFLYLSFVLALGLFLNACSAKNSDELYNLSANEWYELIISDLQKKDLEKADEHYNSMASEHAADPLLEPVLLILTNAHIDEEEYQIANFYLDEYSKKFGNSRNLDYIRYLKIKAKFDSFAQPNRNQALMLESIEEISTFLTNEPNPQYKLLSQTMLTKFNLANYYLEKNIAELYRKTGRDESYDVYKERLENSDFYNTEMIEPKLPWYRRIFE